MQRKRFTAFECPIARTLDQIGDGWSLLILRNALLGATRFQDFEQQLGIAPNTLARRLELLTDQGLFTRRAYATRPLREHYELTEKGLDLAPVLLAISAWGNRWLAPDGAPLECVNPESGELIRPIVVDESTLRPLRAGSVALRAGPGASQELRGALPGQVLLGQAQLTPSWCAS